MATTDSSRVLLGEPLTLEEVAQRLGWSDDDVTAHLAERRKWTNETIDRFGLQPTSES